MKKYIEIDFRNLLLNENLCEELDIDFMKFINECENFGNENLDNYESFEHSDFMCHSEDLYGEGSNLFFDIIKEYLIIKNENNKKNDIHFKDFNNNDIIDYLENLNWIFDEKVLNDISSFLNTKNKKLVIIVNNNKDILEDENIYDSPFWDMKMFFVKK